MALTHFGPEKSRFGVYANANELRQFAFQSEQENLVSTSDHRDLPLP